MAFEYSAPPLDFKIDPELSKASTKIQKGSTGKGWESYVAPAVGAVGSVIAALAGGDDGPSGPASPLPPAAQGSIGPSSSVGSPFTGGRPTLSPEARQSLALAMLSRGAR